ncbi:MAG: molybdopterin-dependent oxidoreductase [Myxococcales bacterium]|nr:molybdopterin-dependent oxidoreductase [Myxococcales bacterium]
MTNLPAAKRSSAASSWRPTACILCECNCGIEVQLGGENGRQLTRFRGDRAHPASQGYACEKPQRLDYYQNGRDRLTTPLRRRDDGSFEAIDWETAISEVAERLARVRDTWGGETIFYYGGGGQGNHLPGAYATATRRVLGSRYRSSALAQEKTGEFWVAQRMIGGYTRADFEHCEVALFIGKNPWHSHSIPRARVTLREIARDDKRALIVIDPRRSETAELADIHLQVRPGCDAWLVAALAAVISQEDLVDERFVASHVDGADVVRAALGEIDVASYCARAGVDEALVRRAARRIAAAESVATMEDLGVQMNRHSTLVSYLHRLSWMLTGNFGKRGTAYLPTAMVSLAGGSSNKLSPVAGARIIGGLVPCNVIAEEILSDHPKRYRAMIVEAANPAHSLADSQRMREALRALDTVVVIDVAMSETAREADYVLPASSQFEKAEATFFNFEFPHNTFHLRRPLLDAPDGPLPEAEIHARLVEALGALSDADVAPLRAAAEEGREAFAKAFMAKVMFDARLSPLAPVLLYRTLGPKLPEGMQESAVLWGLCYRYAMQHGASLGRALAAAGVEVPSAPGELAERLFDMMLERPSGVVFAIDDWVEQWKRVGTPGHRIQLALDDMLAEMRTLAEQDGGEIGDEYPLVLSAGERRAFTANTIVRDPAWRRKDAAGALRISPDDAKRLGVGDGDRVRLRTKRAAVVVPVEVSEMMQPGHISLPNGTGTAYPNADEQAGGVAPNELTASEDRDRFAGTPWHKHVPARIELL